MQLNFILTWHSQRVTGFSKILFQIFSEKEKKADIIPENCTSLEPPLLLLIDRRCCIGPFMSYTGSDFINNFSENVRG